MIKYINSTVIASNPLGSIKPPKEILRFPFKRKHFNEFLSRFRSTKNPRAKARRVSSTTNEQPMGLYIDYYA